MEANRILIVGSEGQIGNYIYKKAKLKNLDVKGTYFAATPPDKNERFFLDITNVSTVFDLLYAVKPAIVIFPAFNPNVDFCETNPLDTEKTNTKPLPEIISYIKKKKIKFIYFSTDYIFDGENGPYSENDTPNPLSNYGKQKLYVEKLITENLDDFIIERVTTVYGWELLGKNFVVRLTKSLKEVQEVKIPNDQFSNPTYAGNIAEHTLNFIEKEFSGIINVADKDNISRVEFAKRIAKFHKLNEKLIIPIKTTDLKQPALRPLKGGFILNKLEKEVNEKIYTLEESLIQMEKDKGLYV